jgi:hypothetical protein
MASSHRDYVPQNAAQFNFFFKSITQTIALKTTGTPKQWDHIPQARITALNDQYAKFYTAFTAALATPTHANILARQEAQAAAIRELRAFVNQFLRFPPVTNPERADMGIPNHDTIRTDHTVVTEKVDFVIHLNSIREVIVEFWIQGADYKAKPSGYDGAVIIWGIRDTPPETPEVLEHHTMANRTPSTLTKPKGAKPFK